MCAAIKLEKVAQRKTSVRGIYHLGHAFVVYQRSYVETKVLPHPTYYQILAGRR